MAITWGETTNMVNHDSSDAAHALEIASWLLFRLTGERYPGTRTTTETYTPAGSAGGGVACQPGGATAAAATRLRLRHAPVLSLRSVVGEDGDVTTEHHVQRHTTLHRRDNRPLNLGTAGLSVTYTHGLNPPSAGVHAAAVLADQLVYAFCDDDRCRLPERVSSITRQGVSYTVLDPQDFVRDGRTGLYLVDLFIAAANPSKAKLRARVFTPDGPRWTG